MNYKIEMPDNAAGIIDRLEQAGHEAYIVGGCVRDSLLGRVPGDWDITTSARPEEVKSLFKRTIDTGIKHGTVTVMFGKEGYEVTTYRVDGSYTDHRRPDSVEFTANLEEDLKRRDFTINAMAYSHAKGIIDLFGGMEDLKKRVIRAVGKPEERFDEDALRVLRAVRFAAQLGFDIEEGTRAAIMEKASFLKDISAERKRVELDKLLVSAHPDRLVLAYELGITRVVLPEFDDMMNCPQNNPHHLYHVGWHSIHAVENIENTSVCRWAALLHDVGKPATHKVGEDGIDHFYGHGDVGAVMAEQILRRLKFDNHSIELICKMVRWHDYGLGGCPSKKSFRKALSEMGIDFFPYFMKIRKADMGAQSDYRLEEKAAIIKNLEEMYEEIKSQNDCLEIKDLEIGGRDLIALGVHPGKEMGMMLHDLLEQVLESPELNNHDTLLKIVKDKFL